MPKQKHDNSYCLLCKKRYIEFLLKTYKQKPVELHRNILRVSQWNYYPLKKHVESEFFFFSVCCPSVMSLKPLLKYHSYSWVVNLLQLVFNQAGSKQKWRKWMSYYRCNSYVAKWKTFTKKKTVTSQFSGSLIRSKGLCLCKISSLMSCFSTN